MEEEKLKPMIKAAITCGVELKCGGKAIKNAQLINVVIRTATICENPDYNYTFTGDADIVTIIPTESGDDRMEFPNCEIKGDALINNDSATIINCISIIRGYYL